MINLSVLECTGEDAQDFLHNQLTQSVKDLNTQHARLFAYCSPRGRVLANGLLWKGANQPDQFFLAVHESVADILQQRLQMYVLRSKVKIKRLDEARVFSGYQGVSNNTSAQADKTNHQPESTTNVHQNGQEQALGDSWSLYIQHDKKNKNLLSIQAPATHLNPERFWLICLNKEASEQIPNSAIIDKNAWVLDDLMLGLVWINKAISEVFLPQNINLDILPAVNFSKGCFPGQEVVARSHYRATIRRRAVLAKLEPMPELNNECFSSVDLVMQPEEGKEPRIAGRIANAVKANDALWLLAETNLDFILEETPLYIANHLDNAITIEKLPFQKQLPWEKKK